MCEQRVLAKQLVQAVADELEAALVSQGFCNTLLARYAGGVAQLLGFSDLTPRYAAMLLQSTSDGFYGGVLTNCALPERVPDRARRLTPPDEFSNDHPVFDANYTRDAFARYLPAIEPSVRNGGSLELTVTDDELSIEQFALAQVMLGQYDDAVATCARLTETNRHRDVRFVIAIEHFRHDRIDEARAMKLTLS